MGNLGPDEILFFAKDAEMAVVGVPLIDHHWNGVVPRNLTRRGLRRPSLELILQAPMLSARCV